MTTEDKNNSSTPETTIIIKNSQTPGNKPGTGNLEPGELGLTLHKGEEDIWTKNASGEIVNLRSPRHDLMWDDLFIRLTNMDEYNSLANKDKTSIYFIESPGLIIINDIPYYSDCIIGTPEGEVVKSAAETLVTDALRKTSQILTDAEKLQVQTNIDVLGIKEFNTYQTNINMELENIKRDLNELRISIENIIRKLG